MYSHRCNCKYCPILWDSKQKLKQQELSFEDSSGNSGSQALLPNNDSENKEQGTAVANEELRDSSAVGNEL